MPAENLAHARQMADILLHIAPYVPHRSRRMASISFSAIQIAYNQCNASHTNRIHPRALGDGREDSLEGVVQRAGALFHNACEMDAYGWDLRTSLWMDIMSAKTYMNSGLNQLERLNLETFFLLQPLGEWAQSNVDACILHSGSLHNVEVSCHRNTNNHE